MAIKVISGVLPTGLCLAVFLAACLLGVGHADQGYNGIYFNVALQTPQEREDIYNALKNSDNNGAPQAMLYATDTYKALQNPYAFSGPQADLEQAYTFKEVQKLNGIYYSSRAEDNWNYWANMWLNGPQGINSGNVTAMSMANPYSALQNAYAFTGPQADLEQANTLKSIQKLNGIYYSSRTADNWNYWANMWLNGLY